MYLLFHMMSITTSIASTWAYMYLLFDMMSITTVCDYVKNICILNQNENVQKNKCAEVLTNRYTVIEHNANWHVFFYTIKNRQCDSATMWTCHIQKVSPKLHASVKTKLLLFVCHNRQNVDLQLKSWSWKGPKLVKNFAMSIFVSKIKQHIKSKHFWPCCNRKT